MHSLIAALLNELVVPVVVGAFAQVKVEGVVLAVIAVLHTVHPAHKGGDVGADWYGVPGAHAPALEPRLEHLQPKLQPLPIHPQSMSSYIFISAAPESGSGYCNPLYKVSL